MRSSSGVGWIVVTGQQNNNMTQILVGILVIAIIGLILALLIRRVGGCLMQMEQARKIAQDIITLEHVDKEFDKVKEGGVFEVVKDLNINVRENEFLVLFGPGQCGKTTILNMIARI